MPSKGKEVRADRNQARQYFAKGEQFCVAGAAELAAGRYDAAVLLAVHGGISSSDAVSVAVGGRRSTDPDHAYAAALLEQVGHNAEPFKQQATRLRTLIALKNRVSYEDKLATHKDAETCIRRCEQLVAWAQNELTRARLLPCTRAAPSAAVSSGRG